MKTNFRKILLGIFIVSSLIGCQKNEVAPSSSRTEKENLIKDLGFQLSKVRIENSSANTQDKNTLIFETKEEAKAYFSKLNKTQKHVISDRQILLQDTLIQKNYITYAKAGTGGEGGGTDDPDDGDPIGDGPPATANMQVWVGFVGYDIGFTYQRDMQTGELIVNNVSSALIGMTLGVSWEQSNTNSFINYPNSTLIHFDIKGYRSYDLIVEGIGTIFTEVVHLKGTYNTKNSQYIVEVE
ncbi:hypothetical protein ACR78F_04555 [Sphingobacterium spiritivorum]|uniref:hypothetical protein n=1 Tax=Sphingobacterium spiritivorum TaxID=258 RepID=UPI003DA5CF71